MNISIIIPVYNAARYLHECLDSVLTQTFTDYEVICVDDGSTDGSGEILEEYAAKDSRIRVIHQKNAGAWMARNHALKLAQGEWITFVDADDVLNKNWFRAAMRIAEKTQADLVRLGCCYDREIPSGFMVQAADEECEAFNGVLAAKWMWNVMARGGFLWRCFIRRDIIAGLEFLPRINCKEDGIWLLGLSQRVKRVAEGRFAGYFYRATEGSLMKRKRKVSQCVGYLEALRTLWMQQKEQAESDGYLDVMRKNIRASADNDVIEWVMMHARNDDLPRVTISDAYGCLKSAGVFASTKYTNRRRYCLGFLWWRRTGQIWAIRLPGLLFLRLRLLIKKVKRMR